MQDAANRERHIFRSLGLAALALGGAGIALAGTMPGMYETLKAQSYYGRPQLALTAEPVMASAPRGGLFELHHVVANRGSAPASDVRLSYTETRSLRGFETVGCANDPAGYPVCRLRGLRPGEAATVALFARVEPMAQAPVRVEAQVTSADTGTDRSRTYNATQTPLAPR